jgi:hypothetical protein
MTNQSTIIQPTSQQANPPDLRVLLDSFSLEIAKQINCVRPGIIQAVYSNNTVDIQIAQQQVTSVQADGTKTFAQFAFLKDVPIYTLGGGGVTITFPIKVGDECLVLFCDREIYNWYLTGQISAPTSPRLHDFSDAICLCGLRSVPNNLSGISTSEAQIRSNDGATSIGLNPTTYKITLTSTVEVIVNSPLTTIVGNMNVEGTGGGDTATIDCNLTQTTGKVFKAGNGATGTFNVVTVVNGIVTGGS